MAKRVFDIAFALLLLAVFALPMAVVALAVRLSSEGPALYWSRRIGKHGVEFGMPKFRTMRLGTPVLATHLMEKPETYLTPIGRFLRRTSLDELPQLWSILIGDMSFVGPRPALWNQYDLISLRTKAGVDRLMPGLTGWAQVNGRDELPLADKVRLDREYCHRSSLWFDLKILFITISAAWAQRGIAH